MIYNACYIRKKISMIFFQCKQKDINMHLRYKICQWIKSRFLALKHFKFSIGAVESDADVMESKEDKKDL